MNSAAKAKGPAEAATSASHGSAIPVKETAMNRNERTTNAPASAITDGLCTVSQAFSLLENPIVRVRRLCEVQSFLAELWQDGDPQRHQLADSMTTMATEIRVAIDALDALYLELHNASR